MVQAGNGKSDEAGSKSERVRRVKPKPPIKAAPHVKVKTVHTEGKVALVQWVEDGKLCRTIIPVSSVKSGAVESGVLASGMPYGVAWEDEVFPAVDAEALAYELRREGIWTEEDLMQRTHLARAAIQRAYINPLLAKLVAKYNRR